LLRRTETRVVGKRHQVDGSGRINRCNLNNIMS
jgi:hypothetical protein